MYTKEQCRVRKDLKFGTINLNSRSMWKEHVMTSVVNPSAAITSPAEARGDHTTKVDVFDRKIVDLIERDPVLHPISEGSKASLRERPE